MSKRKNKIVEPKKKRAKMESEPKFSENGLPAACPQDPVVLPTLPIEIWELIGDYIPKDRNLINASLVCKDFKTFFSRLLEEQKLLHAVFMGREEEVVTLVSKNPKNLLKKGTYRMPLYEKSRDTLTLSQNSEQIYHNVTPLELLLYTGDFKMLESVIYLIEDNLIKKEIHAALQIVKRGGPDLVKVIFDPRVAIGISPYFWARLQKHFYPGYSGARAPYNLLSNPNGIICYIEGGENLYFYADPEKQILELLQPVITNTEEEEAFRKLDNSIIKDLVNNSSRRSSDAEYDLINKIFEIEKRFGKKIERNGIHYQLNGIHYQDTFDGSNRLINAQRKYIQIYNTVSWINDVGKAQRIAMPNMIQRFCEIDSPFFPLPTEQELKNELFVRTNEFYNTLEDVPYKNFYPLVVDSGIGFNFALYKGALEYGNGGMSHRHTWMAANLDLAAVRRIEEARSIRFIELEQELADNLQLSPVPDAH